MRITYLGHSAFLLTTSEGIRVMMDPFRPGSYGGAIRYAPLLEPCDVVTVSHDHEDHNDIATVAGEPLLVRTSAQAKGIRFKAVETFHDDSGGAVRGPNRIIAVSADGLTAAHCGDLGHELSAAQLAALGKVDVLMLPVGGRFTIGAAQAARVAERVNPAIVIPMHYRTEQCSMPIDDVTCFTAGRERVRKLPGAVLDLDSGQLPTPVETMILTPAA